MQVRKGGLGGGASLAPQAAAGGGAQVVVMPPTVCQSWAMCVHALQCLRKQTAVDSSATSRVALTWVVLSHRELVNGRLGTWVAPRHVEVHDCSKAIVDLIDTQNPLDNN